MSCVTCICNRAACLRKNTPGVEQQSLPVSTLKDYQCEECHKACMLGNCLLPFVDVCMRIMNLLMPSLAF